MVIYVENQCGEEHAKKSYIKKGRMSISVTSHWIPVIEDVKKKQKNIA